MKHKGTISINPDFIKDKSLKYTARYLQGNSPFGKGSFTLEEMLQGIECEVKVQEPMVFVFESDANNLITFKKASSKRMEILTKLVAKQEKQKFVPGKTSILFITSSENMAGDFSKEETPIIVDLLEKNGCMVYERLAKNISEDFLKKIDVVVILEDYLYTWKQISAENKNIYPMLLQYLENGGSLMLAGVPYVSVNNHCWALKKLLTPKYGINTAVQWGKKTPCWFVNPKSCKFKDPMQVLFSNIKPHPITEGVKSFAVMAATPIFDKNNVLKPVILSSSDDKSYPNTPVMLAGNIGKGRIVVSGDTYFMQPFRIEMADHLKLSWNIFHWLSKGKVKQKKVSELRKSLWFTEKDVEQMEKAEGF